MKGMGDLFQSDAEEREPLTLDKKKITQLTDNPIIQSQNCYMAGGCYMSYFYTL